MNRLNLTEDVIVVGSGPGGATVSKELTKGGKKVLLLERGSDHRSRFYYGTYPGALLYSEKMSFLFTEEGVNIIAPNMLGGLPACFVLVLRLPRNGLRLNMAWISIQKSMRP